MNLIESIHRSYDNVVQSYTVSQTVCFCFLLGYVVFLDDNSMKGRVAECSILNRSVLNVYVNRSASRYQLNCYWQVLNCQQLICYK